MQAALEKSPNKNIVKNEIKYKIPERWTKPFYKHDIIGKVLADDRFNAEERGKVNKNAAITNKIGRYGANGARGGSLDDSMQAIMQNQYLQQTMPLSNTAF